MKTTEELNALREEVEALNKKLRELTDEEMAQVTGGGDASVLTDDPEKCSLRRQWVRQAARLSDAEKEIRVKQFIQECKAQQAQYRKAGRTGFCQLRCEYAKATKQ